MTLFRRRVPKGIWVPRNFRFENGRHRDKRGWHK